MYIRGTLNQIRLFFDIFNKIDNALIGSIGISNEEHSIGSWSLTYYVRTEQRRQGYLREVLRTLIEQIKNDALIIYCNYDYQFVFEEIKPAIDMLVIKCNVDDHASINIVNSWEFVLMDIFKIATTKIVNLNTITS